jgi:hypothetical protein
LLRTGEFFNEKQIINKQNGAKHRQNPRGKPVSAFHQTLGDEFTFQQDNNLKHKANLHWNCLSRRP